jgi:trehalose 6-phosphate synthase
MVAVEAERFQANLKRRRIILGVDRLDYTKGIDIRLRAFNELLNRGQYTAEDCVLVQIAVPTRESVEDYADLRDNVERLVGRINGTHSIKHHVPVHYMYNSLPMGELIARYSAADVMMVTPLRDGMNLVAKEYCITRLHNDGVLVLSEFAGAALELKQAILVNPFDVDGIATAMEDALGMDPAEQKKRMMSLRGTVRSPGRARLGGRVHLQTPRLSAPVPRWPVPRVPSTRRRIHDETRSTHDFRDRCAQAGATKPPRRGRPGARG